VTGKNVGKLRTKLVAEGANIPLTMDAEEQLHSRGVLVLPDFNANAGGVICGSVEYHGGTETLAATTIEERITANVSAMLEIVSSDQVTPRVAAERLARKRVMTAMSWRQTH
jgi:glutamate dehydrogenase (NAD(P)+)